jgi:hypothetical protein
MELAPVYDLSAVNQRHFRNFQFLVQRDSRLGEIRDRSFEQQRYRASGLTLVTAAIVLWNTVYIERAIDASARNGQFLNAELLKYLSPLGWEHINLTGDYQWQGKRLAQGRFRPLRIPNPA